VLKHHYPDVPNLGDMTKFKEWKIESNVDVLVGGTPCQSFSVAGLRKGLDDPRGNLMLTYLAIAKQHRPRWLVWENVPGVLSSADGRDFGSFLGGLAVCGYGFAYRVLDAQYFGVAQRRKRVFVVGYLGDWRPAAAVLFERHSLQGHPAPSREKREAVASSVTTGFDSEGLHRTVGALCADTHPGGYSGQDAYTGRLIPYSMSYDMKQHHNPQLSDTVQLTTSNCATVRGDTPLVQPTYALQGNMIGRNDKAGPQGDGVNVEVCFTQNTTDRHAVAYNIAPGKGELKDDIHVTDAYIAKTIDASGSNPAMHQGGAAIVQPLGTDLYNCTITGDIACTFTADATSATHSGPTVMQSMAVRRLTPVECERLQGFPDHYTDIKPKGKQTPDGPRYKALGNSMAVPVMNWIGKRIQEVENIK
jgi:DNA (cytosine-5)-methyltransferase 1